MDTSTSDCFWSDCPSICSETTAAAAVGIRAAEDDGEEDNDAEVEWKERRAADESEERNAMGESDLAAGAGIATEEDSSGERAGLRDDPGGEGERYTVESGSEEGKEPEEGASLCRGRTDAPDLPVNPPPIEGGGVEASPSRSRPKTSRDSRCFEN